MTLGYNCCRQNVAVFRIVPDNFNQRSVRLRVYQRIGKSPLHLTPSPSGAFSRGLGVTGLGTIGHVSFHLVKNVGTPSHLKQSNLSEV